MKENNSCKICEKGAFQTAEYISVFCLNYAQEVADVLMLDKYHPAPANPRVDLAKTIVKCDFF